jgi:hypothetical protein
MAVANAVEQVVLGLEMRAPETLTKTVVDAFESAVGRAREARVEHAHASGQAVNPNFEDKVVVVSHQCKRQHTPLVGASNGLQRAKEEATELVVENDVLVVAA